ncbi:hypothetical protein SPONN_8 [uncultured Candidatus Thioglobus sp.]|nr:hypothetical protein SPONN_8 [uncultured Candidatus Thioglobus sp.]
MNPPEGMMDVLLEVREMVKSLCGASQTTVKKESDQNFIVSDWIIVSTLFIY